MTYDNDGPIYSVLSGKGCLTDFNATGLRDPGCPCKCAWHYGFNANYVDDATSCPPGTVVTSWDPENPGYYSCGTLIVDCDCDSPSAPSVPGGTAFAEPMIGVCNGTYGMMCGVCIDGQCTYSSIYPE